MRVLRRLQSGSLRDLSDHSVRIDFEDVVAAGARDVDVPRPVHGYDGGPEEYVPSAIACRVDDLRDGSVRVDLDGEALGLKWQDVDLGRRVVGWGWYYLSTVLDDYSRKILAWKLSTTMGSADVTETLDLARAAAGVDRVRVEHRPRLLSDNGPCYVSGELRSYLAECGMRHTRGAPYHPMTQGKIERYHRSLKNVVKLEHYYTPWELERAVARFVEHYNHRRVHESLCNVTPADMYAGRQQAILYRRERIKRETLERRRRENLGKAA